MKKKLAAFLAMMMALVTMSSAAMAEEETPTITAHKANAITIDGDLSDWDLSLSGGAGRCVPDYPRPQLLAGAE